MERKQIPRRARLMQKAADGLCMLRIGAAFAFGQEIARNDDYKSWGLAASIAILGATDKVDGWLGRSAAKLRGGQTSERGAWLDQISDKIFVHGLLGSMAVSEALHGNKLVAGAFAANQAALLARDTWVTRRRQAAAEQGVETKAQTLGKIKTVAQMAMLATVASPIFDHASPFETGIETGLVTATTGLAIVSGLSLVENLRQQMNTCVQPPAQAAA